MPRLLVAPAVQPPPGLLDPGEIAAYAGYRTAAEHLTARVLARWLVADALNCPGPVPWRDIAFGRTPAGQPYPVLRGDLAAWRDHRGLPTPAVSLSHAGGYAAALVWLPSPEAQP